VIAREHPILETSKCSRVVLATFSPTIDFSGRLPRWNEDSDSNSNRNGGWVGWHDEGGKIRALFRILAGQILGMDWARCDDMKSLTDNQMHFITPYQGSPFDLHVGAQRNTDSSLSESSDWMKSEGFYIRRKKEIEIFLAKLSGLEGEDLCNLVYDCVADRLSHAKMTNHVDAAVLRDVQNVRTYSFLASGFGGRLLASAMRCLFFDYRHYSGGLPDLLLCRALSKSESASVSDEIDLVDLGDFVGETFSIEYQASIQANRTNQMLEDRDDDFLGCSKVGDSGGRGGNWTRRPPMSRGSGSTSENGNQNNERMNEVEMPARLTLHHKDRQVVPECMFVEVKSQNDRLDARQEDWLNILDINGNARVCKFIKKS
jgi:hypothetical protein